MRLGDFADTVDSAMVSRGREYFDEDRVSELKGLDDSHYQAQVHGGENYTVDVWLSADGEITKAACDCPYDLGGFCKHEVAVFYALGDKGKQTPSKSKKSGRHKVSLEEILNGLHKEELVGIILKQAENDRKLHSALIATYSHDDKDSLALCKALVMEHIRSVKYRGFIARRDAYAAFEGASVVLDKARRASRDGNTVGAIELCLVVLPIVVDAIQYCDDSDGHISTVTGECFGIMNEALKSNESRLTSAERERTFVKILGEAQNSRYDGWSDWRVDLLKLTVFLCEDEKLRRRLAECLDGLLQKAKSREYDHKYLTEEVKLIQLDLLKRYGGEISPEKFIEENLGYSSFRELAIENAFADEDYDEVIRLCNDGIKADNSYRGLVTNWKKALYRAYECLGDVGSQRLLARELLLGQNDEYFPLLKSLYDGEDWIAVLDGLLKAFESFPYPPETYVKILIAEGLTERLLRFCKKVPYRIVDLYPYLAQNYPKEVKDLFAAYIAGEAQSADNRHAYKGVCSLLKAYKSACGSDDCKAMIAELIKKYPRRPAFVDELSKLKV